MTLCLETVQRDANILKSAISVDAGDAANFAATAPMTAQVSQLQRIGRQLLVLNLDITDKHHLCNAVQIRQFTNQRVAENAALSESAVL